jgi:hypothetical protein
MGQAALMTVKPEGIGLADVAAIEFTDPRYVDRFREFRAVPLLRGQSPRRDDARQPLRGESNDQIINAQSGCHD